MKKQDQFLLIISFLLTSVGFGQHVKIEEGTDMTMSGDIHLVLKDMSLTNEATITASDANIVINTGAAIDLSTTTEIILNSLTVAGAGGTQRLQGSFDINDVSISSNHVTTIGDTSSLTINTSITNPGDLVVESGGSLILRSAVNSLSAITVYRTTTFNSSTGKYSVVGSPLKLNGFAVLGTNAQPWIFEYDETEPYDTDGSARFKSPSESTMTLGKGYFSAFTGDANGEVVFYGVPQYKNLTYAVSRTDHVGDASDVEGFNLVANPFTSPIEFDKLMNANSSLLEEETIWIWDDIASNAEGGTNDDYITINTMGNTDSRGGRLTDWDGTINVAQGFFVKTGSSGNLSFNQAMKTHDGNDDASYFRPEELEIEKYWIGITSETGLEGTNALIGFHPEATEGVDKRFDASRFGDALSLFSVIDDKRYAIQGLPSKWLENSGQIRLGCQIEEAGTYSIRLQRSENAGELPLYLTDHETGETVSMIEESYTFSIEAGIYYDRFSLSASPEGNQVILGAESLHKDLIVYGYDNVIYLKTQQPGAIEVRTLDGKVVAKETYLTGGIELNVASGGIYVVVIETVEGKSSFKVGL